MRASLIAMFLGAVAPAPAGVPLPLAERQVVSLEFQQPVVRVSTTDPDLVRVQVSGPRISVAALRGGRAALEIAFADGATVSYDVSVDAAHRPAPAAPAVAAAPAPSASDVIALALGEERRFRSPGVTRILVEENGVARVSVQGEVVSVVGAAAGDAALVLVDGAGTKITWQIRVR